MGSYNNYDPKGERSNLEFFDRQAANTEWLIESFSKYDHATAFVVIIHACKHVRTTTIRFACV